MSFEFFCLFLHIQKIPKKSKNNFFRYMGHIIVNFVDLGELIKISSQVHPWNSIFLKIWSFKGFKIHVFDWILKINFFNSKLNLIILKSIFSLKGELRKAFMINLKLLREPIWSFYEELILSWYHVNNYFIIKASLNFAFKK